MKEYTFTGYYPSGNPFLWLYDEHQHTMFTNSLEVDTWDRWPKIGDKVKCDNGTWYINGKPVSIVRKDRTDEVYDELKRSKGLI